VSRGDSTDLCLLNSLDRVDAESPGILEISAEWPSLRQRWIEGPYLVVQEWIRSLPATQSPTSQRAVPTLFAVTGLGGGLGLEHVSHALPEGGATLGLLKALRREFSSIRVKALDVDPAERIDAVVGALFAELDSTDSRIEVGLLRGGRRVVKMIPLPAQVDPSRLEGLNGLQSVVLTGGARGITAEIAVRLAQAGAVRLHLLGRTPLSHEVSRWRNLDDAGLQRLRQEILEDLRSHNPKVTPVEWDAAFEPVLKSLEIDRTLRRIEAAGAEAVYHAVDVGDRKSLATVLDSIRATDGPIQAIVHGAGVEKSRAFTSKTPAELDRTLNAKVDGALHLMALTTADPVRLFVGFSSVSGRFGGLGQADYSTASDLLAKVIAAYGAARPECHALTIDWPAWDEVGMASRAGTRALLQASGQKFLSPSEGADHFLREIVSRNLESEVTITGPLAELDLDRLLPRDSALEAWQARQAAAARLPMVDAVLEHSNDRTITECRLDAGRDRSSSSTGSVQCRSCQQSLRWKCSQETANRRGGPSTSRNRRRRDRDGPQARCRKAPRPALQRYERTRRSARSRPSHGFRRPRWTTDRSRPLARSWPRSLRRRADSRAISDLIGWTAGCLRVSADLVENDPKATRIYHGRPLRGLTEVIIAETAGTRQGSPLRSPRVCDRIESRRDGGFGGDFSTVVFRRVVSLLARSWRPWRCPGSFGRIRVGRHPGAGEACRALIHKLGHEAATDSF
jgi:NAD(P)-dependent dehydrogenase (short-subunit alcohol dehydrogenase family)